MPRTQKYMHTPRGTNGLSRARHLRFGYTRVLRDYTCRVPRILRRRRRNTNCQGDAALAVVASLAPPHERCRASLNATHGKILLICFLLAGTSQRSPKTTRYRHSGSQKHCRKCTSARPGPGFTSAVRLRGFVAQIKAFQRLNWPSQQHN